MYLVQPFVHFFASQHCHSTLTKLLTSKCLTFHLTRTATYGSYGTHVFTINEGIALYVSWFL